MADLTGESDGRMNDGSGGQGTEPRPTVLILAYLLDVIIPVM